jgi:hypothetical protein
VKNFNRQKRQGENYELPEDEAKVRMHADFFRGLHETQD